MSTDPPSPEDEREPDLDEEPDLEEEKEEQEEEESLGTECEVEDLGPCKVKIKAQVPEEKVRELLDRNYRDLISTLQIPGFRRGRVPRRLVEKRYGEEIKKDLREALLNDSFLEVVQEKELRVVGRPSFDSVHFEQGDPFRYEADVEIRPDFELESYKKVEVRRQPIPVTEEDIERELTELRNQHAALVPVEVSDATPEDVIFASYRYLHGGADGKEILRVDETRFRPDQGYLDELAIPELKTLFVERDSDTLVFQARIPDDDPREELRGEDVTVELRIRDAKRVEPPELDDEFAGTLQCESVAQLRERVEDSLEKRHRRLEEEKMESEILARISDAVDFAVPEGLLEEQKRVSRVRLQYQLIQAGKTREEIEEELKRREAPAEDEIRKEIKNYFILEKIAEQEKIFATEDDIDSRIAVLAQVYGRRPGDILRELQESQRLEELRVDIRQSKVKRFLREKARVIQNGGASGKEEVTASTTEGGGPGGGEAPRSEAE